MPELFGYFLTGIMYSEYTFASTSQLLDARKRQWDYDLIEKLGLNKEMFGDIVMPGTVIGDLLPEVEEESSQISLEDARKLRWAAMIRLPP